MKDTVSLRLEENTGQLAQDLSVKLNSWNDKFFGPEGAVGLAITLRNESSRALAGCTFRLDERFEAPLSDLEVFRGFFDGNKPWGRASLDPGETVTFKFHHDNNNQLIVRASDGGFGSAIGIPGKIGVQCGQSSATWSTGG